MLPSFVTVCVYSLCDRVRFCSITMSVICQALSTMFTICLLCEEIQFVTVSVIGQFLSTVCTICLLSEEVQFVTVSVIGQLLSVFIICLLCEEIQFVTVTVIGQLLSVFAICLLCEEIQLQCLTGQPLSTGFIISLYENFHFGAFFLFSLFLGGRGGGGILLLCL